MRFSLDILFMSERYRDIVNSKLNRCLNFIIVKHPSELVIFLSEVCLRILTNYLVSISNDILYMEGEHNLSLLRKNLYFSLEFKFS